MNASAGTLNSAVIPFLIDGNLWELVLRLQYGIHQNEDTNICFIEVIISICSYSYVLVYYSITM